MLDDLTATHSAWKPVVPMSADLPPLPLVDGHFLIDNSSIELMQCPRKFEYRSLRRRTLAASKAGRNFGSTMHAGWAVRYLRCGSRPVLEQDETAINDVMAKWLETHPQPEDDFRNLGHAMNMMRVYNEVYHSQPFKILNSPKTGKPIVEQSFAIPDFGTVAGIPVVYTGKIDLGTEDNEGIWSDDHKTTFMFGKGWEQQMRRDGGQHGYCYALGRILGRKASGFKIDGVRVRRPNKDGIAPCDGTDFQRVVEYVTDDALEEWREDVLNIIQTIFNMHKAARFPQYRWQCVGKYGTCDYYDVCSMARGSRMEILAGGQFEHDDWSPLKQTEGAGT